VGVLLFMCLLFYISCIVYIGLNFRCDFIKYIKSVLVFFTYDAGDELSKSAQRFGGVEDEELGMVQFPSGLDEPIAKIRLRVLQRQMVRRAGGVKYFQRTCWAEQRTEQPFHHDQSDRIRDARGKGILSRRRKRRKYV